MEMRKRYPADADWRPYGHFLPDDRTWTQRHSLYLMKRHMIKSETAEREKHRCADTLSRLYPLGNLPLTSRSLQKSKEVWPTPNGSLSDLSSDDTTADSNGAASSRVGDEQQKDQATWSSSAAGVETGKPQCFALMTDRKDLALLHEKLQKEKRRDIEKRRQAKPFGSREEMQLAGCAISSRDEMQTGRGGTQPDVSKSKVPSGRADGK